MKEVFVFLTTGFEEIEALATIDILRRAGIKTQAVSLEDSKEVVGSHHITVIADTLFNETDFSTAEMLVIPGGTARFNEHQGLKAKLLESYEKGVQIAAICAAPMVLGGLGLLQGKRATAYPGFEQYLTGATVLQSESVVVDGAIITGRGPAMSLEFGLKLVEVLRGKDKSDEIAKQLLLV